MSTGAWRVRLAALSFIGVGCSAAPPVVPSVPPNTGECQVLTPPTATGGSGRAPGGRFLPPAQPAGSGPGLATLLPSSPPQPGTPVSLQKLLSRHHAPSPEQWRALPNGGDAALIQIVTDPQESPTVRARALDGLAVRGAPVSVAPIRALVEGTSTDATVRRAAIRALVRFYSIDAAGVEAAVGAALRHSDPLVREAVVKAVGPLAGEASVRAILQAHAEQETNALVREALAAALRPSPAR